MTVNLNFVSSDGFIKFVHYVYTGQLELGSVSPYDVLAVSSLFGVEPLTRYILQSHPLTRHAPQVAGGPGQQQPHPEDGGGSAQCRGGAV